jgi:hypothetical protein
MNEEIEKIRSQINEAANRLVTLEGSEEIESARQQIYAWFLEAGFSYQRTDSYGNDWYVFPLFDDMKATVETVLKTLEENTRRNKKTGVWNYNPQNGDFITTIAKKIKFKIGHNQVGLQKYTPEPEYDDTDGGQQNKRIEPEDPADLYAEIEEKVSNLKKIAYIAELIILQAWVQRGTNKQHFEGFFTHDRVTEGRKEKEIYGIEEYGAEELNTIVFPALSQKLLEYLMIGNFCSIKDILVNAVRDGVDLAQRIKNVENCYAMGTTGKYYHGQYENWLASVAASPQMQ